MVFYDSGFRIVGFAAGENRRTGGIEEEIRCHQLHFWPQQYIENGSINQISADTADKKCCACIKGPLRANWLAEHIEFSRQAESAAARVLTGGIPPLNSTATTQH